MGVISRAVGTTTMAFLMVSTLGCGADEGSADTSTDTASDTAGDTAAETAMDTPDDTVDDTADDPAVDTAGEAPDCLPPATASVSQGHSPGSNCLTCHAGWFTVAGTLFSTAEGVTAVGGATTGACNSCHGAGSRIHLP